MRGICEGKISEESFFAVLPDFGEGNSDDVAVTPVANPPPSAAKGDDLREALAKLKVIADNAQVPDEPFQLHIGAEVKKLVDRALEPKR